VDRIAHFHLDIITLALHPHIRIAQLPHQEERRLRLLPQGKAQRVLLAALVQGRLHVVGQPVEAVRRTSTIDALMRALKIVIVDPMRDSLTGIGEGGKVGLLKEFPPDGLPEALDLAQGHRVLWSTAHMLDAVLFEHLLEAALAPPGHKLAAVVRQDFTGCTEFTDGPLHHFQHRLSRLLPIEAMPYQKPGMVVDDANQIALVHPLQVKGEDVDLPAVIGVFALKPTDLRRPPLRLGRGIAQAVVIDHLPHRFRTHRQGFRAAQLVPYLAYPFVRMRLAELDNLLFQPLTTATHSMGRGAPHQPINPLLFEVLSPLVDARVAHPDNGCDLRRRQT
jgi:hypothetical protein